MSRAESKSALPKGRSVRFDINSSDSPQLQSSKRRREFLSILDTIEKNTGGEQPAMVSASSIMQIAKGNGIDDPRNRLKATIEQGTVVAYDGRVCLVEPGDLVAAIEESDEQELREALARCLAEVRADE